MLILTDPGGATNGPNRFYRVSITAHHSQAANQPTNLSEEIIMKTVIPRHHSVFVYHRCIHAPASLHRESPAVDANPVVPAVVQKGFDLWAERKAATWAMDIWKMGGLMESDSKCG